MVAIFAVAPGLCFAAAYKAPRGADGKPNLNGIWQSLNSANWDIQGHAAQSGLVVALGAAGAEPGGLPALPRDELPHLPDAAKKNKEKLNSLHLPDLDSFIPGSGGKTLII
jgi:hypothetical protein